MLTPEQLNGLILTPDDLRMNSHTFFQTKSANKTRNNNMQGALDQTAAKQNADWAMLCDQVVDSKI